MAELPSWLQAPDVAGDYQRGLAIGTQVASERARLAQQQQETALRLQVAQQQDQQERAMQQQRLATEAAHQQQQIELRKQQLNQVKAVNDQKTAAAARAFAAKQQWQAGFNKIHTDPTLTDEQKDAAETSLAMSLAPMMGTAGTEVAAMLRDMRPTKPTVPASAKPRAGSEGNVTVQLPDPSNPGGEGTVYRTVPKTQAPAIIAKLPPNLQTNAVNSAAMGGRTVAPMKQATSVAKPQSQADFDALPPGTLFVNPKDQKVYRKKGQLDAANSDSQ